MNARKKGLSYVHEVKKLLLAMSHQVEGPGFKPAFFGGKLSVVHSDFSIVSISSASMVRNILDIKFLLYLINRPKLKQLRPRICQVGYGQGPISRLAIVYSRWTGRGK